MQLNLIRKSQPRPVRSELLLQDYFGCGSALSLNVLCDEAVGKSAFAEESTFDMFPNDFLAVDSLDLFVDDVVIVQPVFFLGGKAGTRPFVLGETH